MLQLRTAGLSTFLTAVLAVSTAAAGPRFLPHSRPDAPAAVPGAIVVALPPGESFAIGAGGVPLVGDARRVALLAREGLVPVRVLGHGAEPRAAGARAPQLAGRFALLRGARPDFDAALAARSLRESGLFTAACPDYEMRLFTTIPNDPHVPDQWWVRDTGGGLADVRLPEAWDVTHGSPSIVIAILDTGVDLSHPDLASRIWTNPHEIAGNGIDDDHNGYIDDVHGWDFGAGDNDPDPEPMIDDIGLDEGFHGTMCAGIAAAATDNAEGIAGAGWNSRIMPIRIFDSNGNASSAAITDAVAYAVDNGAKIISMSFGAPDQPGLADFFQALIDEANAAGVVCVAAAGNDSTDTPVEYPAACRHVIACAATTMDNVRADFSNYGSYVDVAAPGASMFSTLCQNYVIDDLSQIFYLFFFGWDGETPYMYGDGTSFACPLVAGVAALALATHPGISPDGMESLLVRTGDPVAYDHPIGPRLNAFRAVSAPTAVSAGQPLVSALTGPWPNPTSGTSRLDFALARTGEAELAIYDAGGRRVRLLASGVLAAGAHEATWDGTDARGNPTPAGLYFARLTGNGARQVARIVRLPR